MDWKIIIAAAKAKHGWTQQQLAEAAGCTQPTLSVLERGLTKDPHFSVGSRLIELAYGKTQRKPRRAVAAVQEA